MIITNSDLQEFKKDIHSINIQLNTWFKSNLSLNLNKTHLLQFLTKNSHESNLQISYENKQTVGPACLLHPFPAPHFKTVMVFLNYFPKCPSVTIIQSYAPNVFSSPQQLPASIILSLSWPVTNQTNQPTKVLTKGGDLRGVQVDVP
jgi:hypothetical protein